MNNEKLDTLLNLSMDATQNEREKSEELDVGYDPQTRTWQIIVKASGGFEWLTGRFAALSLDSSQIRVHPLLNGYAILTIPQDLIDVLASQPEIEYIEKPKRLFFSVNNGRRASCIPPLQAAAPLLPGNVSGGLFGQDTLIAVIDSGIDYAHPDFRNPDGTTRILELWDQNLDQVYTSEDINLALQQESQADRYRIVPSRDISGHGTHVAGICAGNGLASNGLYRGVAPESLLLIIKLGNADPDGFPRTTELMLAVDYALRKARSLGLPVAVNMSFGNNYGSHDGTSLLETYLDEVSSYWKSVLVTGTGNEGDSRIHTSGRLIQMPVSIDFSVGLSEASLNLQLWKSYSDAFDIRIRFPDGTLSVPLNPAVQTQRLYTAGTTLLIYYGEPRPYSSNQEIYIDFLADDRYITPGLWTIELIPRNIVQGEYHLWMPGASTLSAQTGFLNPTESITQTIPSTASRLISVAAYNSVFDSYAAFSGRGGSVFLREVLPDLAAPGVNITSCAPGGGYAVKSGTSMAAPFVTGAAALLMEWGIGLGNDPFLYGEKLKAYLLRGARRMIRLPDTTGTSFPNAYVGWGTLCAAESLPV